MGRLVIRLTFGAVVVAGQDGAGVVAETAPVVVVAAFDALGGGGDAGADDAMFLTWSALDLVVGLRGSEVILTHQWRFHSQKNHQK